MILAMEDDLRPLADAMSTVQSSKRVRRTEIVMDITLLVKKGIIPAPTEISDSDVVTKGYRETIRKAKEQLEKDESELTSWTQLLADLELEETNPGTGSLDAKRQEAMKTIIASSGSVSLLNNSV